MNIFRLLLEEMNKGRETLLATVITGNEDLPTGHQLLYDAAGRCLTVPTAPRIQMDSPGTISVETPCGRAEVLMEHYPPPPTLIVFGSGHIAECLANLARLLLFQVMVVDDRAEYANWAYFANVDQIYCGAFNESIQQICFHNHTYLVLATRGHRTDAVCLSNLLNKPVPYIGMVGSARKIRFIRKLLQEQGLDPDQQSNLYAPVGLDLHSETPQEIAFSIMAEIQLLRNGGTAKPLSLLKHKEKVHSNDNRRSRPDLELIRSLAQAIDDKRNFCSITITHTAGHVPRGVGCRAIVWEDGSIMRTVGGGKRESELIDLALKCLATGETLRQEIHFSDEYDGYGPVCGGRYTVFIQPSKA